ncbi:mitochondrial protein [Microdochium trichocladiopsis]|uniref:Mitochondrial protein n=1 Tax=Microdochium trichocladiopsis TaxID=1682393 RepID=A0A9P8YCS7_9PEZI|nr:mitochondrial protein [Microdochium trichocladiopsis]KAH7035902.1 mitochondrial protein [Microdochium trichocladiopsis]
MSKLSEGLKALINASHARPGYTKASPAVQPALARFARDATDRKVGLPAWVTVSTAVSATLNCPEAMTSILHLANDSSSSSSSPPRTPVQNAELIREVGLKCISFNGIPRTINTLGAFHASLPASITGELNTTPKRSYTPQNLAARQQDGLALWDSVYRGFERKLIDKLATSHPDLPVHILASHYANLLSDPTATSPAVLKTPEERRAAGVVDGARVGRVLTSLVAIACLRAQTGVGPQVVSHVFGLRKAYDERYARECGGAKSDGEDEVEGGEWLSTDEGNVWLLESVDRLVEAIAGGTTFAPGMGSKL